MHRKGNACELHTHYFKCPAAERTRRIRTFYAQTDLSQGKGATQERDTHRKGSGTLGDSLLGLPLAESPRSHLTTSVPARSPSTRNPQEPPVYLCWASLRVSWSSRHRQLRGQPSVVKTPQAPQWYLCGTSRQALFFVLKDKGDADLSEDFLVLCSSHLSL